ncbi:unnamed protein product [Ilex paraguariensis]|uniref:RNase III domain-containing protein n=1 Tax=Ilex paraguariensis TaxID=185542 RepID=A0ABC8S8P6_9AQUA
MAMEDNEEQVILPLQYLSLQEEEEKENYTESMTESPPSLEQVEEIIGYKFKDPSLLQQAFTHVSFTEEECSSYERLEYMGDSVLNLLIAKEHYFLHPELPPGKLTRLRAANVDTEKLARVAVKHGLHKFVCHRKPLLDGQIREFMDRIMEYPLHSNGLIDAPKVLADIVESTIGAIFIDSSFSIDTTWKPIITPATIQTHPVTRLYEICQKKGSQIRFVDLWNQTGEIEVYVDNEFLGRGKYSAKKLIALNRAAEKAYNQLVGKKMGMEQDTTIQHD